MDPHTPQGDTGPRIENYLLWFLGGWLLLLCADLTIVSWSPPYSLRDQVEVYLFHFGMPTFLGGILLMYVPYFAGIYLVSRKKGTLKTILLVSVLARLLLIPGFPILETDIFRYLWDGRVMGMGGDPYRYSPRQVAEALHSQEPTDMSAPLSRIVEELKQDPLHQEILSHINNSSVPTIYLPTSQFAFALGDFLVRILIPNPTDSEQIDWYRLSEYAIVVWKSFLFLFEVGILILVVLLLRVLALDSRWVLVYGWSPLVLKEYSNTGHFDPIVIFFSLLGIAVLFRSGFLWNLESRLRRLSAGFSFALGISCKIYPVFFVPLFARLLSFSGLVGLLGGLFLTQLPFLGTGEHFFTGLATYSERWENNSGLVSFLEWFISCVQDFFHSAGVPPAASEGSPSPLFRFAGVSFYLDAFFMAKLIAAGILFAVLVFLWWDLNRRSSPSPVSLIRACFVSIGTLLLVSPTVFPWYVAWVVPFLCFFPSRAWLLFSFLVQVYYLRFWNQPVDYIRFSDLPFLHLDSDWEIARVVEYLLFYSVLASEVFRNWKKSAVPRQTSPSGLNSGTLN